MQFGKDLREGVAAGRITVSIRLWSRPQVKVGGRYRSPGAELVVDDLELIPFAAVTDEDVRRSGEADLSSLRRRAAHAGPIHDDTLVYRVEFHLEVP